MSGPTAAVDPPYRLLASTTVVVGVSPGEGDNEVVVTQQSQGVSVYNVQSSECVQHWAIRSDVRLTHAAVLQPRARRVLAVRDHTTAFSWSSDAAEVDMGATKMMALPILRVLQAAPLLDAACVVTIDGAAVVCDAELRTELASIAAPAKHASVNAFFCCGVWPVDGDASDTTSGRRCASAFLREAADLALVRGCWSKANVYSWP